VTFFKTQADPPQYCPELRDADLDVPVGAQIFPQFPQCSIRLIPDPQSQILDRFCGDTALAATWARQRLFLLSRPAQKSRDALGPGNTYMKACSEFPQTSFPIFMRFQNFPTQII
jgi:hypothetical protein